MASPDDFIEDGHKVHFRWDRDELAISHVECPHEGRTGMCNKLRDQCVVAAFVAVYGAELNIGSIYIDGPVEVGWYPIAGECDVDREFAHVWLIPVADPDFKAAKFIHQQEAEKQELADPEEEPPDHVD